ncbi:uncharacterized protein LY89DRAFT_688810 [Mollisia scopiformis]|uniref:Phosphatidylglycerol/phosphatidylinositol transfer protein n=1 Tax=Mollisia scopiformis TaxID=149040 RepID=A0A194WVC1_MOLSC|nr:uncharacterized protein LY89DRAFT_688810 [Mollisia scopiformis]KUJ11614.1 hypothetical protein LY89DRAFT_688810 [Mollisia scopiformis]
MHFFITAPLLAGLASAGFIDTIESIIKTSEPVEALSEWSYTNCGTDTDAISLHSFTLSPDPPVPGSPLTATFDFTANSEILEGAYVDIDVKLGFIILLSKTIDLCDDSEDGVLYDTGVSCPIAAGDYVLTKNVDLPAEIPPAKFTVESRGYTFDDQDMFCVDVVANFMTTVAVREGL